MIMKGKLTWTRDSLGIIKFKIALKIDDCFVIIFVCRENIIDLEIYYPSLQVETITQTKSYELEDYFGN